MTDPVFRPDIQDALLRLLFDKHRINLLKVPREDLQPGQALLLAGSGAVPDAFGPVALQNLVPGLVLPEVARDARLADVDATFSDSQEGRVEGGIFASFLERFWPGATLPSISAKAEASGGRKLFLRFSRPRATASTSPRSAGRWGRTPRTFPSSKALRPCGSSPSWTCTAARRSRCPGRTTRAA
jgi:hypothetical protein